MIVFELIAEALRNLRRHKLRSFLTALGIIFGIASVMSMVSTGEGARRAILAQIEELGTKNIIINSIKPPAEREASEEVVRRAEATRKLTNGHLGPLRIKEQQIEAARADLRLAEAELVAARIRLRSTEVVSPVFGQRHGHPLVIARSLFAGFDALKGSESPRELLKNRRRVDVPVDDTWIIADLTTRSDLQELGMTPTTD